MTSFTLCLAALVFSFIAGRRSLIAGLVVVLAVGYAYGILRANVIETFSHFIFDAAVVGLFASQALKSAGGEDRRGGAVLKMWVGLLAAWPLILFFVPIQDYAVQFVGLRGNVFLLPFILLGARLRDEDVGNLAYALAVLNLTAFAFACAEYLFGVERFYPPSQVTELIYRSAVDENFLDPDRSTALRIPATFTSAHAFAGTLVLSLCYLIGAWFQKRHERNWRHTLLQGAIMASILGVFMAAARSPVIILALVIMTVLASARMRAQGWLLWAGILAGLGWVVSSAARLQRFLTLQDVEFVSNRISWSVNGGFFDLLVEYPLGNGLGGGGTSIPYFLQASVVAPTFYMENEYARIVLEQGAFGLCLWLTFLLWLFLRPEGARSAPWFLGRRLLRVVCAAFFFTGMIGVGLLTSIPGSALMLLSVGWIATRQSGRRPALGSPVTAREAEGGPARLLGQYV